MNLSNIIRPEHVFADFTAPSKQKLLQALSKIAGKALAIPEGVIFEPLSTREKLGSTGIGNGIAIPHSRLPGLEEPFGMFVRLGKPVDFEAIDETPVDIVFLLLMPDRAGKDHLNVLACIARRLREPEVLRDVRSAPDAARLYLSLVGSPL